LNIVVIVDISWFSFYNSQFFLVYLAREFSSICDTYSFIKFLLVLSQCILFISLLIKYLMVCNKISFSYTNLY